MSGIEFVFRHINFCCRKTVGDFAELRPLMQFNM